MDGRYCLFSGNSYRSDNEVVCYDASTNQWEWVYDRGSTVPAPNGGDLHTFAWDHVRKEYITLDGGRNGRQAFAFNITTRTWRPLTNNDFMGLDDRMFVSGSGTAVSPDHDLLVIFGGAGLYVSNVARLLDLRNRTYSEVAGPASLPRRSYVQNQFLYISSLRQFLLFGGRDGQSYLNDLWLFDPQSKTWTPVAHQNPPTGRYFAQMAYDPIQNTCLSDRRT